MQGVAIEPELSVEEALGLLTPELRDVWLFHCHAECADLSATTAIDLEEAMRISVPDELSELQDLAETLISAFRKACADFLEARRKHGLSASYPDGNKREWCIEDNSKYGARAFVEQDTDRDCIRIQSGTLDFLLWAALKHTAANESDTPLCVRRRPSGRMTGSLLNTYDIPHDPAIRSMAVGMAITAFQFVFLHEIGHLAQGHCRFLTANWSDYRLDSEGGIADPRRQSMEMMADIFALRELLKLFQARREAFEKLPSSPRSCFLNVQSRIYTDGSSALACLSSALACLFYLTSPGGGQHPKRELRFISLMLTLKHFADFEFDDSDQNWVKRMCNVVSHVGEAMRDSHDPRVDFKFITSPVWDETNHETFYDEILALLAQFEKLRPDLLRHARSEEAFVSFLPQPWPSF